MKLNLHAITVTFGLSLSESEVFEYLLQYGSVKAVDLRKNLHLDRAPCYRTLSDLESKNLVVIKGSLRKQIVDLQDIISIKDALNIKKKEIEQAQVSLSALQANMKELRDNRYHKDNVEIFSGSEAYLESMLCVIKGGGKIFRDITPDSRFVYEMAGGEAKYRKIIREFKAQRIKLNIAIRILFDNQAKNIDELSATNPVDLKESRVFGGNLKLDCYLNTCGSRSLFYTKDASGTWGIVLKDPLIANLLNSLFDVIWNLSKPL